jgi:titin
VNNNGGVSIGADGLVTVTGLAGATSGTVAITSSRPKFESATASISGTSLNSAFIPTFGAATPTADGFVVTIANYSSDYTWSASVATGAATISGGVLTVTGQSAADQAVVTVITNRSGYATGRAQVVATALADGLTPNFGPSLGTPDGFTIQIRNYSNLYTWNLSASSGQVAINATGLITVTGLAAGASSTVTVSTSKTGSFTVITQASGKAPIASALTPRFTLSTSTGDGFTAQILNYDAAYTWSGAVNAGSVTISGTGLVTVTGVSTGIMATATISTVRAGYVSGSNTIAGTAVAPRTQSIVGEDIKLEVPISAATSSTDVTVVVDIPVDAAPSSTSFTGSAVATDTVDQGLRTIRLDGSSGGTTVTTVSAPIAITIPASAGIGVPVYSPDGANWVELPLLASASLPDGQEMGYYKYDDGTILILTRKIGG